MIDSLFLSLLPSKTNKKKNVYIFLLFEESKVETSMNKLNFNIPEEVLHDFTGQEKQIMSCYHGNQLIVLVGLGKKKELIKESSDFIFQNLKNYVANLKSNKQKIYILPQNDIPNKEQDRLENLIFQIIRINYHFNKYKSNKSVSIKNNKNNKNNSLLTNSSKNGKLVKKKKSKKLNKSELEKSNFKIYLTSELKKDTNYFIGLSNSLTLVRNIGNEPANILNPKSYVELVKKQGKKSGFKVKVFNSRKLEKLGLHSLLSVSSGSQWDGYLVEISLPKTDKKNKKVCLVGKGITFDTGGISLKIPLNMAEMKTDMLGSATVLGVMDYLGQIKSKLNVIGYLAIAENMPDAKATRPGDIVKAYNGKTIEILNTDAEGRLVLADALVYAQKHQKPEYIIDFATLTGQQESVSCSLFSSLISRDDKLASKLIESGNRVDEKIVRFPLYEEFVKHTESQVADVKNSEFTCRADMIQAGAFLSNFVEPEVKWAHLDIAGPARYLDEITGVGIRLTVDLLSAI